MPPKIREVKSQLRRVGFDWRPGKGSHQVWFHEDIPDQITIAGADGDDAPAYLLKRVRSVLEKLRDVQRGKS